jgi:hypothetical protein
MLLLQVRLEGRQPLAAETTTQGTHDRLQHLAFDGTHLFLLLGLNYNDRSKKVKKRKLTIIKSVLIMGEIGEITWLLRHLT